MSELDDMFEEIDDDEIISVEDQYTLCDAICEGNIEKVKMFITEDTSLVNSFCEDYYGETPLVIAVEKGNYEVVKILLDAGANPYFGVEQDTQVDYSKFPLTIAENRRLQETGCDERILAILKETCKKYPSELASEICWNLTVDDNGVVHYQGDLWGYVLNNINRANVNMRAKNGDTPLIAILKHHFLLENGYWRIVEFLLDNGADPNAQNDLGRTPLSQALFMHLNWFGVHSPNDPGYVGIVKMLLDYGADFGYALYCDPEYGKHILDRMKVNARRDNLQEIINSLFSKFGAENE